MGLILNKYELNYKLICNEKYILMKDIIMDCYSVLEKRLENVDKKDYEHYLHPILIQFTWNEIYGQKFSIFLPNKTEPFISATLKPTQDIKQEQMTTLYILSKEEIELDENQFEEIKKQFYLPKIDNN